MKKIIIAILVIAAVYSVGAFVRAVANGQAEGAVLSAEKQLLDNGDFENGTTDWTAGGGATISSEIGAPGGDGSGIIRMVAPVTDAQTWAQQIKLTAGKTYRATGYARGDGVNGYPRLLINGQVKWNGTTSNAWQQFDTVFESIGTVVALLTQGNTATEDYTEWDDVFVTEYTGDMTNAEKQDLPDGDMEDAGVVEWTGDAGGTATKESGAAVDGSQVLRVTGAAVAEAYSTTWRWTKSTTFRVTGWARSDGTCQGSILEKSWTTLWTSTISTDWQWIDVIHTSISPNRALTLRNLTCGGAGNYMEWDDLMITEYHGETVQQEKQLLPDGDMEDAGVGDWPDQNSSTITKESTAAIDGYQILRITKSSAYGWAYQSILTLGKTYKATGYYRTDGTANARVLFSNNGEILGITSEWTYFEIIGLSDGTNFRLNKYGAAGEYVEFDDVLVTEL